jgi:hypothetical protein
MRNCPCGSEVTGRRSWCETCLPSAAVIGQKAWRRTYKQLRREAEDALAAPTGPGAHLQAFTTSVAALGTGPQHAAVIEYGRGLARQLDERPTATVGREYRLCWALLLAAVPEEDEYDEEQSEFLRKMRTAVREDGGPLVDRDRATEW